MALILRSEKGAPLTTEEIDDNFSYLKGICDALQAGVTAEGIQSVIVDENSIRFIGTEATVWGPFTIPPQIFAKGIWVTATAYPSGSLVQHGSDLVLVLVDHISSTFDDDLLFNRIVKAYVGPNAAQVSYDHTASGMSATTVQAAIDELVARVAALEAH